ncbi:MAG: response regulator [Bacteroidota bacterium]|nr:response regulator [Bacteroidota bacterium]
MKILVVDDEKDMQALFEQRFRKDIREQRVGFVFASSGSEALSYLKVHNKETVLILSDINMPGMTGLELLKQIKQEYKTQPPMVMMITAYGDMENYNSAIRLGADGFFTKPLDFSVLREKLKMLN